MKISAGGIYDVSLEDYHGDLCAGPSLSSSGAREIVSTSPARFFYESYLNPNRPAQEESKFDFGTAAHTALLEPDTMLDRIVVVAANDWRTNAAKAEREKAREAGKVAILAHQAGAISEMGHVLVTHPIYERAWTGGHAEQTFVWRDPLTEIWLKARPDYVRDDFGLVVDYKTTIAADEASFARRVFDHGYFQQAAWCLDGIEAVTGTRPEEFWLVAQEVDPPYLVQAFRVGPRALDWGKLLNRKAIDIFATCVESGNWPGYPTTVSEIELPSYAETQLELRHECGEFSDVVRDIVGLAIHAAKDS